MIVILLGNEQISRQMARSPSIANVVFHDLNTFVRNTQAQIALVATSSTDITSAAITDDLNGNDSSLFRTTIKNKLKFLRYRRTAGSSFAGSVEGSDWNRYSTGRSKWRQVGYGNEILSHAVINSCNCSQCSCYRFGWGFAGRLCIRTCRRKFVAGPAAGGGEIGGGRSSTVPPPGSHTLLHGHAKRGAWTHVFLS